MSFENALYFPAPWNLLPVAFFEIHKQTGSIALHRDVQQPSHLEGEDSGSSHRCQTGSRQAGG